MKVDQWNGDGYGKNIHGERIASGNTAGSTGTWGICTQKHNNFNFDIEEIVLFEQIGTQFPIIQTI